MSWMLLADQNFPTSRGAGSGHAPAKEGGVGSRGCGPILAEHGSTAEGNLIEDDSFAHCTALQDNRLNATC